MNLSKSINNFYIKYKKLLALIVVVFFAYKIFNYYQIMQEGYSSSQSQCSIYHNCAECVNNFDAGNLKVPCLWSSSKNQCSAFNNPGYSRTCPNQPTKCSNISNCTECVGSSNNCFWGDRDQKCSATMSDGYGKICSGSNPGTNCPKCELCPKLTLLKTPTFITQQ